MPKTKTYVYVRCRFAGYHRWKDAPPSTAFLRDFHRHLFHVKVSIEVSHANRDVEFFALQSRVRAYLADKYEERHFEASCEMIAADLLAEFGASLVEVSEDGENGAVVTATPED